MHFRIQPMKMLKRKTASIIAIFHHHEGWRNHNFLWFSLNNIARAQQKWNTHQKHQNMWVFNRIGQRSSRVSEQKEALAICSFCNWVCLFMSKWTADELVSVIWTMGFWSAPILFFSFWTWSFFCWIVVFVFNIFVQMKMLRQSS